jgi:competence protein ComEC
VGAARAAALDRIETWLEGERDQLALWLPVGLGSGIAAWFALPDSRTWAAFLLFTAGLSCLGFTLGGAARLGRAIGIFALAALIGTAIIWWRAERVAAPRLERPMVASFEARIEAVQHLPAREMMRLTLAPNDPALPPRVRVNLDMRKDSCAHPELAEGCLGLRQAQPERRQPNLSPGALISLRARLMPPAPPAVPGAYDFARVAWFQGIGATGRVLDPPRLIEPVREGSFWTWLADLRARLSAHIRSHLDQSEGGIAAALVTGDVGGISEEDSEAMRRSGLAHLLSISGLHVTAVVAGTMLFLLRALALSPRLALRAPLLLIAAAGGALAGVAYTLLSGAEVPTVRSCIAALLVLLGLAIGREAITLRLVAVAALTVLLFRPEALAGPSFQLSFAAVTAIVALHEQPRLRAFLSRRDEGWGPRAGRALLSTLLTGIAVEIALAPIALFHFHKAGLYGAAANIVAIPLTTFVIMPAEALALLLDLLGLGAPFWWIAGKALSLLIGIARLVAEAPGAVAALPSMPRAAFALMIAGGLWIALWRTRARRLGLIPFVVGATWALATPAPDLLVTGDGRHLALRFERAGEIAILRSKAGDYVRSTLSEASGHDAEPTALDELPSARCTPDLCAAELIRDGRRWRILATRSPYLIPIRAMNRACAAADIVVSDRRLPRTCRPRWLKTDRLLLARTGGLAIDLSDGTVRSVADEAGRHGWVAFER